MRQSEETSTVLVIRAWHEPGGIRARLTHAPDEGTRGWEQAAADGEDAILAAVREWLRASEPER